MPSHNFVIPSGVESPPRAKPEGNLLLLFFASFAAVLSALRG